MHLSEPIGAFNTFVLICSSVTIVLALECAKSNKAGLAKIWMLVTLVLGSRLPGREEVRVQRQVLARHLSGVASHRRIYERADLDYGSAARLRLNAVIAPLAKTAGRRI